MSALWTAAEAAAATGGTTSGDWQAGGVSIDTRTLAPGDLFVALKDVRDGHDFVAAALTKGAAAALVSRVPEGVATDAPLLLVDDVLAALEALARAARARTKAQVIAITGSVGKTSTKDMAATVLAGQGLVHAAEMSLNNHWGVPLTLARLPRDADFAVVEIGMNHPGEITPLSRLARPHVALITTVAEAHMAAFASVRDIARAKAEVFAGLEPGGTAILNLDIATFGILETAAAQAGARIVTFGTKRRADYHLKGVAWRDGITSVQAENQGQPCLFRIGAPGRHLAMNALAVLAAVDAVGADRVVAALDLARWQPPVGRGERTWIHLDKVDEHLRLELIDDAYNANPASMAAAFEVLAGSIPVDGLGRHARGRRVAFLTDMLELGPEAAAKHAALAVLPAMQSVNVVHTAGPLMQHLHRALPGEKQGEWHESAEKLAARAHRLLDAGDVVMVKGSKGSRASLIVETIRRLNKPVDPEQ
ncbi:MAG: UDP-N-acetylmuramoyl-tripeptide--D-alanyl-D-alanine ligase [Rhodobacteraceae bacterium]|nr:UDP-N-acetylmuramoyl-tripeptide--D-alanyl-D-alanine ligase [Paracoccaceae bacterium]